ncbi:polysaccharide pyruvyl transferase family protein [Martelella lutilitoris]|uniref:Polysaccharide pyruvyl transferase family protein n=1 Tax=Martelella lutilitoris TaxID=2583532 RepID=A0A7T7HL93_9HYPH|nr:polysaccharide pyruvyl transferase family protein [Martelella lutilitoris]QQM31254.1 polysaccharide pyruvyl transferase family protein [Martelella lutilitoris]
MINDAMPYWRHDKATQNFGDFLTEYFREKLFYGVGLPAKLVRVVGSALDDNHIGRDQQSDITMTGTHGDMVAMWGCGMRSEESLSLNAREECTILSVRGPLSRSILQLGASVPIGDPGLLLPALYTPQKRHNVTGRRLLVPHFNSTKTDQELLDESGCDSVLRPAIEKSCLALEAFIDELTSADFVLAASLHAAIAAVAYGIPFAYWDSGDIDLEFKWRDFSASIGIPCNFCTSVQEAEGEYASRIAPSIKIPPLLPVLGVAPFPIRQQPLLNIAAADIARYGITALEASAGNNVQKKIGEESWAAVERLMSQAEERKKLSELNSELAAKHEALEKEIDEKATLVAELQSELDQSSAVLASKNEEFEQLRGQLVQALENSQLKEQRATALQAELDQYRFNLEIAIQRLESKRKFGSSATSKGIVDKRKKGRASALSYIVLPYNKRRKKKLHSMAAALRAFNNTGRNLLDKKEPTRPNSGCSLAERFTMAGYILLPFNRRRKNKRNAMLQGL